jgi:hypothetical protein
MTDFYSLLRKSIESRDLKTAEERKTVYEQARKAMIRTLWSAEPRLPEDEIASRIASFDVAVERIEGDFELPDPAAQAATAPTHLPAVYEGYDEAADYAPASATRPSQAPARRAEAERAEASQRDLEPAAVPAPPPKPAARRALPKPEPEPEPEAHGEAEPEPTHADTAAEDSDPLPSLFRRAERVVEMAKERLWRDDAAGFEEQDAFDRFDNAAKPKAPKRKRSEREIVGILTGVIAGLAVFLVGFMIYVFYRARPARRSPRTARPSRWRSATRRRPPRSRSAASLWSPLTTSSTGATHRSSLARPTTRSASTRTRTAPSRGYRRAPMRRGRER